MKSSEKLIQALKEQDVKPVPKWQFTLKNSLQWTGFLVAVTLGALAFSVVLFAIQQTDFNIISHFSHSRLELFLGLLPFVWIVFLVVFLGIAFFSIRHSKKGYKFTVAKLAGFSAGLSILLGTLYFLAGGASHLDQAFAINVSLYESIQEKKMKLWSMPEEGYLSGEIVNVSPDFFQLKDFKNKVWEISFEEAFIPPVVSLEKGEKVKIVGKMLGSKAFSADEIRPWGGAGKRMQNRGLKK